MSRRSYLWNMLPINSLFNWNRRDPSADQPLHVLMYTDAAGIGGAEISLGHLVATASPNLRVTVAGVSQSVVDAIANRRTQTPRIVLPSTGIGTWLAHR